MVTVRCRAGRFICNKIGRPECYRGGIVFRVELYIVIVMLPRRCLAAFTIARCLSMRAVILCAVDAALHSYILGNTKS